MCVCQKEGTDLDFRANKRTFKKTPGGETVLHYKRKKPSKHICAECGKQLNAVPRGRPYQIRKLSKTKRRPNRPYGGNLDRVLSPPLQIRGKVVMIITIGGRKRHNNSCKDPVGKTSNPIPFSRRNISSNGR